MSASKAYVRVTMQNDGKTPLYELVADQMKVCELSYIEVLELAMQATSSLRCGKPTG